MKIIKAMNFILKILKSWFWIRSLRNSTAFSSEWYLLENPDVANTGLEAATHYVLYGANEGREPSASFDELYYLANLTRPLKHPVPFIDFVLYGQAEGVAAQPCWSSPPWWWGNHHSSASMDWSLILDAMYLSPNTRVIIPVLADTSKLRLCIQGLYRYRAGIGSVVLMPEATELTVVTSLVEEFEDKTFFCIEVIPDGRSFTQHLRHWLCIEASQHLILLSPVAEVGPGWVSQMQCLAFGDPKVSAVSVINTGADCLHSSVSALSSGFSSMARLVRQSAIQPPHSYVEATSLCMFIKQDVQQYIDFEREIRFNSAGSFVIGFINPNSLWRQLADPKTFIGNLTIPVIPGVSTEQKIKPRLLFVLSTETGGTPQTNQDLMTELSAEFECFVLQCDSRVLKIQLFFDGIYTELDHVVLPEPVLAMPHTSDLYDAKVAQWLYDWAIELVHIRHCAWHSLGLFKLVKAMGLPLVHSFHDFYTLCPSVKLLDEHNSYCAARCTEGDGQCKVELWPERSFQQLKHGQIQQWQQRFAEALLYCDAFVTTNEQAKVLILATYPQLQNKTFAVIPHGRSFEQLGRLAVPPVNDKKFRVLFLGNLTLAKGMAHLNALAEHHAQIEVHVLGTVSAEQELSPRIIRHGAYQRDGVMQTVESIAPNCGVIGSIWPETWCHTLTELWACGVPVVAFDVGAVGERIRRHGAGWLAKNNDFMSLCEQLLLAQQSVEWQQKMQAVLSWQSGEGAALSTKVMADAYQQLYLSVTEF